MQMRLHLAAAVIAGLAMTAGAQAPPAPKPVEKKASAKDSKPKPRKVWTDDDLATLRKPSDVYAEQKAVAQPSEKSPGAKESESAAAEAEPTAAPTGVNIDPKTGKPYLDPNSAEALEARLKKWEADLQLNDKMIADARREMDSTSDAERFEDAKRKLDIYQQNREEIRQMMSELRAQLEEARRQAKSGGQPAPAPGQPPR